MGVGSGDCDGWPAGVERHAAPRAPTCPAPPVLRPGAPVTLQPDAPATQLNLASPLPPFPPDREAGAERGEEAGQEHVCSQLRRQGRGGDAELDQQAPQGGRCWGRPLGKAAGEGGACCAVAEQLAVAKGGWRRGAPTGCRRRCSFCPNHTLAPPHTTPTRPRPTGGAARQGRLQRRQGRAGDGAGHQGAALTACAGAGEHAGASTRGRARIKRLLLQRSLAERPPWALCPCPPAGVHSVRQAPLAGLDRPLVGTPGAAPLPRERGPTAGRHPRCWGRPRSDQHCHPRMLFFLA